MSIFSLKLSLVLSAAEEDRLQDILEDINERLPLLRSVHLELWVHDHDENKIFYWDQVTPLLHCNHIRTFNLSIYSPCAIYLQQGHLDAIARSWSQLNTFTCHSGSANSTLSAAADLNLVFGSRLQSIQIDKLTVESLDSAALMLNFSLPAVFIQVTDRTDETQLGRPIYKRMKALRKLRT
ncbi:hypothetical protein CALCODRAFT_507071 [Calocera cornea HHB12733]|uniref:Uncharacterized protein n=1 Tax=Calocera cornea HHB12733 TaxID=1353952 RepID=A0A165I364_9BASI|nr:hypothetical protein CALCODRAFT_507071 [Calocera cornea HHB12733]